MVGAGKKICRIFTSKMIFRLNRPFRKLAVPKDPFDFIPDLFALKNLEGTCPGPL